MSFYDEELPEEGRNHDLALHILMNCNEDALSNVLVDTGSSLNVFPKSTLERLSYQGLPMRYNSVIVKAFDGSRKTVIGEVDLPIKIGPSDFQITFQVMDIHLAYSCLLGRPCIHEVGDVTSTLHRKLKFVKNEKLVVVGGEKALLAGAPMSSLKDAKEIVQTGSADRWSRVMEVVENKNKVGLGFQLVLKHIEYNNPTPSPNFDFPVFEAEEENDDEEVSDELFCLLEHEEKAIQLFEEKIELVNLDFDDDVKEVKIGSQLCPEAKKGLVDLLREYSDMFA
ncbi:hypothetical protein KIW84_034193 [Lathyrus oleraceus]|uniref:Uncharacterized protein n=1 Tax=Pisum sativum TaxID=3888 RepID=A0A9D4Y0N8_PEA|nr:hypothetical protein KIW84_034193 [Pisum sativum]